MAEQLPVDKQRSEMTKLLDVADLKAGDVVLGSGERFTIERIRPGVAGWSHPYLFVRDSKGNLLEHDTSFQSVIEIEEQGAK